MASDIALHFTSDTTNLDSGFAKTSQSLRKLGTDVKQSQSRMAGLGGAIQQGGFAVQDFVSILEMGGKNSLQRALMSTTNNVQMLGAAFGPWGLAITAVGGALATILIPRLLQTTGAFEGMAESMREATSRLSDFIAHRKEVADVGMKFEGMDSKGILRMREDVESRRMGATIERESLTAMATDIRKKIAELEKSRKDILEKGDKVTFFGFSPGAMLADKMDFAPAIKSLQDELAKLAEKLRKNGVEFATLDAILKKVGSDFELSKRLKKEQDERDAKDRKALMDELATPQERFQASMQRLSEMMERGVIDQGLFDRAADAEGKKLFGSFGRPADNNRAFTAASADAFSLVARAQRGDPRTTIMQQQVRLAKEQLGELKRIAGAKIGSDF